MRQAVITIRWEGPDKKVRGFIEDRLDAMFEDMTCDVPGVTFADASTQFWSRVPWPKPSPNKTPDPEPRSEQFAAPAQPLDGYAGGDS